MTRIDHRLVEIFNEFCKCIGLGNCAPEELKVISHAREVGLRAEWNDLIERHARRPSKWYPQVPYYAKTPSKVVLSELGILL